MSPVAVSRAQLSAFVDTPVRRFSFDVAKLNTRMTASTPAPVAGLGFRYAFNESWHVKVEFDHYDGVGDAETTGAANINVAAFGIGCRF